VNGDPSTRFDHRAPRQAYERGRALASKMRELIPRRVFGGDSGRHRRAQSSRASREGRFGRTCSPKCYGGTSRASASCSKAEEGKKRMKQVGRCRSQERLAVLKMGPRPNETGEFKKSTLREYFESIVIAVILALVHPTFVVQAFKSDRLDGENLLIRRSPARQQVRVRSTATSLERALLRRDDQARGGDRLQVPKPRSRTAISSSASRVAGEKVEVAREEGLRQRQAARRAVRALPAAAGAEPGFHEVTSFDVRERSVPFRAANHYS